MRAASLRGALAVLAVAARGAAADPAQAKALFDDGRKLIESADKLTDPAAKAKQVAAACDKFTASLAEDALLGTRLNLADCRVRQGNLVEAYALLETAVAEATRTHDREAFAQKQLAAVTAKVVRVQLHLAQPVAPGTKLALGGRELPETAWSSVQIVEPGAVTIEASAPGRRSITITRDGTAGAELAIEIPALEPVAAPPPLPVPEAHVRSKVPYIVIGAGGALFATSCVLGLHARSRYNTAKAAFDRAGVTSAQHEADVATVVLAGSAVAVGVGVWLYVRDRRADRPIVTAAASRNSVALSVIGSF